MVLVKVLAIIGVIVGIYFFIEEQLDINLNPAKMEGKDENAGNGNYLESVTGASIDEQLIEVLLMISSCLKAGRNLDQAFELVAISTPPPIRNEFRTLTQERRLGVPMVEALTNLSNRVPSQDLRLAVSATIFQQETGGNLEDLYNQILLTITERKKIMGKIVAGTAHARLSGNLVATIPVILAIVLVHLQPDYLKPMITNPYGQIALLIAATATIIGVVFINRMTSSILPDGEEVMINKNDSNIRLKKSHKLFQLIIKPFVAVVSLLIKLFPSKMNKEKNETRFLLNASGKSNVFEVEEFIGLKLLTMSLLAIIMMILVNPVNLSWMGWLVMIALLPIGYMFPRIYLAHLIKKRQKNIEFELPYVIDLLSLAIESGLDLTGGIQKVVEKSRNTDIISEFKMFLADIKVGKGMQEALDDMAERVRVLSFFSFVSSLIQAQRLGADIGPTLRAQAEQMRYQRLIFAEERVNKLPVKLLIPLVFFVFPSISVLLIGPAMIQIQTKFPKPEQIESEKATNKTGTKSLGQTSVNKQVNQASPKNYNERNNINLPQSKVSSEQNPQNKGTVKPISNSKVQKSVKSNNLETVPVVSDVTPAPIIITEPVETPSRNQPIDKPSQQNLNNRVNQSSINNIPLGDNSAVDEEIVIDNSEFIQKGGRIIINEGNKTSKTDEKKVRNKESNMVPIEIYIDDQK